MKLEKDKHIGIIGTGMIGTSMAVLFTGHGYKTTLFALSPELQKSSKEKYDRFYQDFVDRNMVSKEQVEICEKYINYTLDYNDLANVDVVVECVFEELQVKFNVYKNIEKYCTNAKVIISTTSALSVDDLVEGLDKYKDIMVVAHPFNPPHLVPFFEVVKSQCTRDGVTEHVVELLEAVNRKVVVLKKSAPGFIANRLQHALFREAIYMVENGIADARDVDIAAMYSFMPRYTSIGIFEHLDNSGVDLNYNIENYLFPSLSSAQSAPKLICDKMDAKEYGVKSGKGIYDWSKVDMKDFSERISAPYWGYFNWKLPTE